MVIPILLLLIVVPVGISIELVYRRQARQYQINQLDREGCR